MYTDIFSALNRKQELAANCEIADTQAIAEFVQALIDDVIEYGVASAIFTVGDTEYICGAADMLFFIESVGMLTYYEFELHILEMLVEYNAGYTSELLAEILAA